jgi:hypothetical protein
MISQLIYTSDATDGLTDADLTDILEAARRNNAQLGLTGMLLFGRGHFIQVLEGADHAVEAMMARIGSDSRTAHVRRLMSRQVESREFADWSMGFHRLSDADWIDHPAVNHFFADPPDMSHFNAFGSPARFMLQAFRDIQSR